MGDMFVALLMHCTIVEQFHSPSNIINCESKDSNYRMGQARGQLMASQLEICYECNSSNGKHIRSDSAANQAADNNE
jgi:hypothetical protein